jgi:hypothetical protein
MVEITLFEVHFDDAQFDANAEAIANAPMSGLASLFGSGDGDEDAAERDEEGAAEAEVEGAAETAEEPVASETTAEGHRPGPSVGKLLVLVLVLAAAAMVARRLLGGDDESLTETADEVEIAEIDVGE